MHPYDGILSHSVSSSNVQPLTKSKKQHKNTIMIGDIVSKNFQYFRMVCPCGSITKVFKFLERKFNSTVLPDLTKLRQSLVKYDIIVVTFVPDLMMAKADLAKENYSWVC